MHPRTNAWNALDGALTECCYVIATIELAEEASKNIKDDLVRMVTLKKVSNALQLLEKISEETIAWMHRLEEILAKGDWDNFPGEFETEQFLQRVYRRRLAATGDLYTQFNDYVTVNRASRASKLFREGSRFERTRFVMSKLRDQAVETGEGSARSMWDHPRW